MRLRRASAAPAPASGLKPLIRLTWIFLGLAILIALPFFIWGERLEASLHQDRLVEWFQSYRGTAWIVAILLLVSDLLLPIPNTMIIAALGVIYGPVLGGVIATLGNVFSGMLGYSLCRRFGRPFATRLVGAEGLKAGGELFARSGGLIVAASRWLPVLPEVIACMAGLTRMSLPIFLLALVAGSAPLGFVVATLGYLGSDRPFLTLILCAALPIPLWYLMQRLLAEHRPRERHFDAQEPKL